MATTLPPSSVAFSLAYIATLPEPEMTTVLPFEAVVLHALEHFLGVVAKSVTGSLGTGKRTAVRNTLTGKNAGKLVAESLILTVEVSYLSATDADIARRNVRIRANMLGKSSVMKLWQKRMISPSDLPFGSKSEPPLPPPMGRPVKLFLNICSKPRNLITEALTDG